jgi:hypothetical protein
MATEDEEQRDRKKEQQIGAVLSKYRELLNQEIAKIDPRVVVELAVGPHVGDVVDPTRFFSDWPDTWNDGDRWVKTWGKGGGIADLKPLEELRERLAMARLRAKPR